MQKSRLREIVILLVPLWHMLGCVPGDTRISNRFDNTSAAEVQGLFQRGWLPDVLPREAGPIEEVHDLDTNARCSRSEFPPRSSRDIEQALRGKGFIDYEESLPETPFRSCPFSLSDASAVDTTLARRTPFGTELAVIDERGVLMFWSSGS